MKEEQTKHEQLITPFRRCYWVIPGKLMAGSYPGARNERDAHQKLTGLLNGGIRHFIDLMEPDETDHGGSPFDPYVFPTANIAMKLGVEVTFDRFGIKDTWVPTRKDMGLILDRIDACIDADQPVYLHCWGGRGRTGTVVGCYLARHGHALDHKVLAYIRELRRDTEDAHMASPETPQQIDLVLSWVEGE